MGLDAVYRTCQPSPAASARERASHQSISLGEVKTRFLNRPRSPEPLQRTRGPPSGGPLSPSQHTTTICIQRGASPACKAKLDLCSGVANGAANSQTGAAGPWTGAASLWMGHAKRLATSCSLLDTCGKQLDGSCTALDTCPGMCMRHPRCCRRRPQMCGGLDRVGRNCLRSWSSGLTHRGIRGTWAATCWLSTWQAFRARKRATGKVRYATISVKRFSRRA
jgi:hypothetical protein